jgi:hypothetical protein
MPRNFDVSNVQIFLDADSGYRKMTTVATQNTSWQLDMEPIQQWTTLTPEAANTSSFPVIRQQEKYSTGTLWISGNFWVQFSSSGSVIDDRKWTEYVYRWKLKLSRKEWKRRELKMLIGKIWNRHSGGYKCYCLMGSEWVSVVLYKDFIVTYGFW